MITIDIKKQLKTYGGPQALTLCEEFTDGSVTKIYGPSGAGKTTFLKILAGLITPDAGKVIVNNYTWLDTGNRINLSPQKRHTGFVFQDYALFPNMTVKQHLQYASTDKLWINKLLALGKLEPFAASKPLYLSGGQQQRLAILRALATKPGVLLMDEPFSALDNTTRYDVINALNEYFSEQKPTVFIVSHNQQELDAFNGRLLNIGG